MEPINSNEQEEEQLIAIEDMDMENKATALTYLLTRYMQLAMQDARQKVDAMIPDLVSLISTIFPRIIEIYDDPRMAEYAQDKGYWAMQLGRIMDALSGDDLMHRADVLYFETGKNLLEFFIIIDEKGIAL